MDLGIDWFDPPHTFTHDVVVEALGPEEPRISAALNEVTAARVEVGPNASGWVFRQASTSPYSDRLRLDRVLDVYLYRPFDMTAILEFDARITERYSAWCAEVGEYYGGTFTCDALGPDWLTDISGYDLASLAEVRQLETKISSGQIPADVQDIIDECKSLQDREGPRYLISLVPRP